jgi:hypothetical protein
MKGLDPIMTQQYDNTVLHFTPALPCQAMDDCAILTEWALIGEIEFTPACPTHGYAYSVPLKDEYASVERFVVNEMEGQGVARVLRPCSPSEAPGYEEEHASPEVDSAWCVAYTDKQGNQATVFAVWCVSCLEFYLHQQD